jgi:hypothetical protein
MRAHFVPHSFHALVLVLFSTLPSHSNAATSRSIGEWVNCSETSDQTAGVVKAFAAAKNDAFLLTVDCPVHLNSGMAVDRGIFIDNGTSVEFTGNGKFFVNNLFHPAFIIADSSNISLTHWNVEWDGSLPVNPDAGGYEIGGKWLTAGGSAQPAHAFNDIVLRDWLHANRSITFDQADGLASAIWSGSADAVAVFYITGSSENIKFTGLKLYAPATAGGSHFIPMAFALTANWQANKTVKATTPETSAYAAVPSSLTFSGVTLDGTIMGWQGNTRHSTFTDITSDRYGDLQDADGNNVGGIDKWFPPPHLFYLNNPDSDDKNLWNADIDLTDVDDIGKRIGVARDKGGRDSISGYAASLKLACIGCTVENYTSDRPDGFMDLLPSTSIDISKVNAEFNSAFLNNLYPPGLRFPSSGYVDISFVNVQMKDTAPATIEKPIGNANVSGNKFFTFSNFNVTLGSWAGSGIPTPVIAGTTHDITISFSAGTQNIFAVQKNTQTTTLTAKPAALQHGGGTTLAWEARGSESCKASNAWAGTHAPFGSEVVSVSSAGTHEFTLECMQSKNSVSGTVSVLAH